MHTLADSKSQTMRERVLRFVETGPCPRCGGSGLKAEAHAVTFLEHTIAELNAMPLSSLADSIRPTTLLNEATAASSAELSGEATKVAVTITSDLLGRIEVLLNLGLGYLSLSRSTPTLSPGEMQRLRIATELRRAGRGHTLYLLDEPTTGLHPADLQLLLKQLGRLVDAGNTVVVVEHDMDVVAAADWVIDLGPGGGDAGGRIMVAGTPETVAAEPSSRTAPYLTRRLTGHPRQARAGRWRS